MSIQWENSGVVRYTVDGSDPTETSTTYSAPFNVTEACTIKAISIGNSTIVNSGIVSLRITKETTGGSGWVETPLNQIPSGSEIVIVAKVGNEYYAMTNDGAGSKGQPLVEAVTPSNGTLSNPVDKIKWTLTVNNGEYHEQYLHC